MDIEKMSDDMDDNQKLLHDLAVAKATFQLKTAMSAMGIPKVCPICSDTFPTHYWNCTLNK